MPAAAPSVVSPITTRRMSFEESLQEVPRHFGADGDLLSSHIAACLSSVFPDGEDFFVRSVRMLSRKARLAVTAALEDRTTYNPVRFVRSFRRLLRSPIISAELWRELRAYNQPGFHPSDHDATELLETWRERLFGADGALNDRLAGVA